MVTSWQVRRRFSSSAEKSSASGRRDGEVEH